MKQLGAILCLLVISGCVATGPAYRVAPEPTGADALIYIYRPNSFAMSAGDAYFYVDDVNIANLTNGGYTWFYAPAGEHTLKQKWFGLFSQKLFMRTAWLPAHKYFYRFETSTNIVTIQWRLSETPADRALMEITCCKLQPAFGAEKLRP